MINLISQEVQKKVHAQYFLRLGVVALLFVAGFLLFGILLLAPSYFITLERVATEEARAVELRTNEAFQENKELGDTVNETKEQLRIFNTLEDVRISETALMPLLAKVESTDYDIRITQIDYRSLGEPAVIVQGVAGNRDHLLAFVDALETEGSFSDVRVPVSSFVQNTNIAFEATLFLMQDES